MDAITNEIQVEINGVTHTVAIRIEKTAKGGWLRNAAYSRLYKALQDTVYAPLLGHSVFNGKIYQYITIVCGLLKHDLPFQLPNGSSEGGALAVGLEQLLDLDEEAVNKILSVTDVFFDIKTDPDTAPPEKVSEEEKKIEVANVKRSV